MDADGRGRRRAGENDGDANDAASRKTTHAVVRAVKSSVREGVVFATPVGASDTDGPRADAAAIGVGLAFVEYLTTAKWLAKDFVWLVLDARAGSTPGGSTHAAFCAADLARGTAATSAVRLGDEGPGSVRPRCQRRPRCSRRTCSRYPPAPAVDVVAGDRRKEQRVAQQDLLNTAVQLARRAFRARVGLNLDPLGRSRDARGPTSGRRARRPIGPVGKTRALATAPRSSRAVLADAWAWRVSGRAEPSDVRRAVGDHVASVFARARASVPTARTPLTPSRRRRRRCAGAPLGAARDDAALSASTRVLPAGLPADRVFAGRSREARTTSSSSCCTACSTTS